MKCGKNNPSAGIKINVPNVQYLTLLKGKGSVKTGAAIETV
jgi:hypothetical protein